MIEIAQLKKGEQAKVTGFAQGAKSYRQKLMAMGLTPGTCFKLSAMAPLGDPVTLEIRGYQLTLRKNEAKQLIIERC